MPKLEMELLEPTYENALEAFSRNYLFRSDRVLETIYALYGSEKKVIVINGDWGSGKTFFTKEIEAVLKSANNNDAKRVEAYIQERTGKFHYVSYNDTDGIEKTDYPTKLMFPFYYDAWLHDYDGDPLLSLILSMTDYLTVQPDNSKKIFSQIKQATIPIVKLLTKGVVDLGEFMMPGEDCILLESMKAPQRAATLEQEIKAYIYAILKSINRPQIVVLIDELDRCRPDFAVDLLERIKHYFNCPGISFVISANLTQLEHAIKARYGLNFDARRYLKRFFDLELKLPQMRTENFNKFYDYSWNYLDIRILNALCDRYSLSLRDRIQLQKRLGLIGKFHISSSVDILTRDFVNTVIVPILVVLDYVEEEQKVKFLKGQSPELLTCLVKQECAHDLAKFMSDSSHALGENDLEGALESIYEYLFMNEYSKREDLTVGRLVFYYNQMPSVIEEFNFVLI